MKKHATTNTIERSRELRRESEGLCEDTKRILTTTDKLVAKMKSRENANHAAFGTVPKATKA